LPAENRIPYTAITSYGGYVSSSYGDVVLLGLDHAVVPGDHDKRNTGSVEPVECFEHGCICPGPGFDNIEEVACMDEDIGFL